jgi:hypothetical protein
MYMTDGFKGLLQPSIGTDLEKTEVERKAEMLLQIPIEEIQAEVERDREKEKEKQARQMQAALTLAQGGFVHESDHESLMNLNLDGRLVLKDKVLKEGDLEVYHEIDRLKPDDVAYLVNKLDSGMFEELDKIEFDEELDSDPPTRRSYHSNKGGGGDFWEEIETEIKTHDHVIDREVRKENMSAANHPESGMQDVKEAYGKD